MSENQVLKIDVQINIKVFLSENAKENTKVFNEKHKATFQNR